MASFFHAGWATFARVSRLVWLFLLIEWLDEVVFGAREAAWPLIRRDLGLSYVQVGLLLGLPGILGNFIELPLGVLGDVWRRRTLVVGGGLCFALALAGMALAPSFPLLLLATILFFPASGAFVSLSQATLMDLEPQHQESNMVRWDLAGSVGVVTGPLVLGSVLALGGGWRVVFLALVPLTLLLVVGVLRAPFPQATPDEAPTLRGGLAGVWRALRRRAVLRWLLLLECADLMGDVLLGFVALYLVDVAGASPVLAGAAVALFSVARLVGEVLLLPLLTRWGGLCTLRASATVLLLLYPAFVLVPSVLLKLPLLGVVSFVSAGWYALLKAQLYAALPGQSGTTMTLSTLSSIAASTLPLLLGWVAEHAGLGATMWLLAFGPLALVVGLWRVRG